MTSGRLRLILSMLAYLAVGTPVAAQRVTGAIAGTVTGDAGAGLAGVTITVVNQGTGLRRTATTGPDGRYVIASLPVEGEYEVRAELEGFAGVVRDSVTLAPNEDLAIDFSLKAAAAETVLVIASASAFERPQSFAQQTIHERLVRSLPLSGRNFVHLTTLAAGFTGNPGFPSPQGQLYWTNNVLVDGASHFSKWRSAARTFYAGYGLESIKEVQVLANGFSAEFGEALAAVTSAVTKAGTNEFRGAGLFFFQNDALNATPVFAVRNPPAGAQQYGFTLGGPVVLDRTHFFGSYEGRRLRNHNIVVSPAAFGAVVPDSEDEHLVFYRVDDQTGRGHLVMGRYNGQFFRGHNEVGGLGLPAVGTSFTNDTHTMLFTDTFQVSGRLLSEVRGQFARYVDVRRDLQPTVFVSRAGYSTEGGALGPVGFGADPEDTWEAANTLSYWRGSHALKLGGGLKYVRAHNPFLHYGRGAYFFAGPPDLFPQPFLFMQSLAPTQEAMMADPRDLSAFGFVQEAWKVRPRVTVNAGLRYDIEDVRNVRNFSVPVDKNNIQPRLATAWDVSGAGRMVVRGGVGLYSQQHLLYYIDRVQLEGLDGTVTVSLSPDSPLFPRFPNPLPALPPGAALPPRDIHRVGATFKNPYSIQGTLGFDRTLGGALVVAADYVYLNGRDLMSLVDANAPASNPKPRQRSVAEADATRPIPALPNTFRKIITLGNLGHSSYHALQIKAGRSVGRFQTMASYTLSHAEDMDNYQLPEDSRNIGAEQARANTDVKHNAVIGMTWDLPEQAGLLNGWSLSGLGVFRSNRPYDITWGDDRNGTTQNDARPGGRNTGKTEAFGNVDLALTKRFPMRTRVIEARLEAFNVFNTTNFNEYVGTLLSPLFAKPVSAFPKRRVQLAAIVRF